MKRDVTRRDFVRTLICGGVSMAMPRSVFRVEAAGLATSHKPNLLIIHTDEHNFRTLGCYRDTLPRDQALMWGPSVVETPHIDRLAKEGALCTNFYATTPLCSPSRASFVSGCYPQNTPVVRNNVPLDDEVVTFAELLRRKGYATGYAGKWHLDGTARPGWAPSRRFGFEDNRYMFNRGHWKKLHFVNGAPQVGVRKGGKAANVIGDEETFTTDWLFNRALEFLEKHKNEAFCHMISMPDPHGPDLVREPYRSMYADQKYTQPRSALKPSEGLPAWGRKTQMGSYNQSLYYGMVKCIDDNVGRILRYLEENGLLNNTIVVFTSDHGDLRGEHHRHNKGVIYEASAKIPFVIRWPKKIEAARIVPQVLDCTDFLPTILALMEVPTAGKEEGRDASGLFISGKAPAGWNDMAFIRGSGQWIAAVTPRYKLVLAENEDPWLFDRKVDPDEIVNQFAKPEYREEVRHLAEALLRYGEKHNDPRVRHEKVAADLARCIGSETSAVRTEVSHGKQNGQADR